MALSLQPNQNNRGVLSVRPLSTMKEDQFSPPLLAERILASRAAAFVAAGLPDIYQRALFHWPTDPMNNNHIVTSSSGDHEPSKKTKKRRALSKRDTEAPLSPPSSGSSPPVGEPPRDKVFTCKVCSRSFGYKHVLQNHERTHTGEKPFECRECHKRFTRDHHLKTHLRLHTGEKPYSCPHCPRHFVQVANLRRHLRVHTGEKPYACARCQARFSDSNQLKAHALIHDGEKPFGCSKCGARFRRRHHLLHHRCGVEAESHHGLGRRDSGCEPDGGSPAPAGLPSPAPSSLRDLSEDLYGDDDDALSGCSRLMLPLALDEPLDCSMPEQTEPEDLSLPRRQRARSPPPAHVAHPSHLPLLPAHLHRRRKYHVQC